MILLLLAAILIALLFPDFMRAIFAMIGVVIGIAFWGGIIVVILMFIKVSHGA